MPQQPVCYNDQEDHIREQIPCQGSEEIPSLHEISAITTSWCSSKVSVPAKYNHHHYQQQDQSTQTHPLPCPQPYLALDIRYMESVLLTPLFAVPFPHPKWRVGPGTGAVYEDGSVLLEAFPGNMGYVMQSIEVEQEDVVVSRGGKQKTRGHRDGRRARSHGEERKKDRKETRMKDRFHLFRGSERRGYTKGQACQQE
jgi:hypothetical protein